MFFLLWLNAFQTLVCNTNQNKQPWQNWGNTKVTLLFLSPCWVRLIKSNICWPVKKLLKRGCAKSCTKNVIKQTFASADFLKARTNVPEKLSLVHAKFVLLNVKLLILNPFFWIFLFFFPKEECITLQRIVLYIMLQSEAFQIRLLNFGP